MLSCERDQLLASLTQGQKLSALRTEVSSDRTDDNDRLSFLSTSGSGEKTTTPPRATARSLPAAGAPAARASRPYHRSKGAK